jgi:hypothetical protein
MDSADCTSVKLEGVGSGWRRQLLHRWQDIVGDHRVGTGTNKILAGHFLKLSEGDGIVQLPLEILAHLSWCLAPCG